jgi:hypothetical protein
MFNLNITNFISKKNWFKVKNVLLVCIVLRINEFNGRQLDYT